MTSYLKIRRLVLVRCQDRALQAPVTKQLHVTFGSSKRLVQFQDGEEVKHLRHHFLRVFSDVLSDEVAPKNVTFQSYDKSFDDYLDLPSNTELHENSRIKALIVSKQADTKHHCTIPLYSIQLQQLPDVKPHLIDEDTPYRLWNIVSNGLIQRSPADPTLLTCMGGFNSNNTVIKAKQVGINSYYLVFEEPGGELSYITPAGGGQQVTVQPSPSDEAKFEPDYYWGHTVFKSSHYNRLYLGCDENKMATLVHMKITDYPNPQAMFIVNEFNVVLLPDCN
ncbi:unnamed protein product [Porites lobata]|uniref:Uncharacterized protein n=1 Tax=Porites lobata TaxID=104759 RepID=A0ABN8R8Z0_9CNID|nr:unnamed protein product [Porites lobata]